MTLKTLSAVLNKYRLHAYTVGLLDTHIHTQSYTRPHTVHTTLQHNQTFRRNRMNTDILQAFFRSQIFCLNVQFYLSIIYYSCIMYCHYLPVLPSSKLNALDEYSTSTDLFDCEHVKRCLLQALYKVNNIYMTS